MPWPKVLFKVLTVICRDQTKLCLLTVKSQRHRLLWIHSETWTKYSLSQTCAAEDPRADWWFLPGLKANCAGLQSCLVATRAWRVHWPSHPWAWLRCLGHELSGQRTVREWLFFKLRDPLPSPFGPCRRFIPSPVAGRGFL